MVQVQGFGVEGYVGFEGLGLRVRGFWGFRVEGYVGFEGLGLGQATGVPGQWRTAHEGAVWETPPAFEWEGLWYIEDSRVGWIQG